MRLRRTHVRYLMTHSGWQLRPVNFFGDMPVFCALPPSPEFLGALSTQEHELSECGFCGRIHFSTDYEAEKSSDIPRKDLQRLAKKRGSTEYVAHDTSTVSVGSIDGVRFVIGCPCNAAACYERLFKKNLQLIARFSISAAQSEIARGTAVLHTAASIVIT